MANQNFNQNNNQGTKARTSGLKVTDTLIDLSPVAVVYNLTNKTIEDFVFEYLASEKKIDKFEAVRVIVEKTPNYGNIIQIYGFISPNSADVKSNTLHVNSLISEKLDNTTFKTSPNLQSALSRVAKDTRLIVTGKGKGNNPLAIRLDTFKVLSLMLAVDPYKHELQITEVKPMKKGASVCAVIKKEKFVDGSNEDRGDKYTNLIARKR